MFLAQNNLPRLQVQFFAEGLQKVADCEEWTEEARAAPREDLRPPARSFERKASAHAGLAAARLTCSPGIAVSSLRLRLSKSTSPG